MKKYLIPLLLVVVLALSACGSCDYKDTQTDTQVSITEVQPIDNVVSPSSAPEPTPQVVKPDTPVIICPQSSVGCSTGPYPYAPRPVGTITPDPTPVCVRDATPLVFVDPFWVDNCGNKYGQVTV